MTIAIITLNIS